MKKESKVQNLNNDKRGNGSEINEEENELNRNEFEQQTRDPYAVEKQEEDNDIEKNEWKYRNNEDNSWKEKENMSSGFDGEYGEEKKPLTLESLSKMPFDEQMKAAQKAFDQMPVWRKTTFMFAIGGTHGMILGALFGGVTSLSLGFATGRSKFYGFGNAVAKASFTSAMSFGRFLGFYTATRIFIESYRPSDFSTRFISGFVGSSLAVIHTRRPRVMIFTGCIGGLIMGFTSP